MKYTIYENIPNSIEIYGQTIELDLAFNHVLKVNDLKSEISLSETNKLDIALELLTTKNTKLNKFNTEMKINLLNIIFDEFINIGGSEKETKKIFDIAKDTIYIYSSFIKDYNIDLFEELNKLHWFKFSSLLVGLSKDTKLSQVIDIRTRKIPKRTKYNSEEIKEIIRLKNIYKLKEDQNNFKNNLKTLFQNLKNRVR